MAAKKKTARKSHDPEILRLKEFLQIFHDTDEVADNRAFCFIIGSGASITAGIPTGKSLVDRWIVEMHDADDSCEKRISPSHATIETFADALQEWDKKRLKAWSEKRFAHLPGFTFDGRAAFYGQIYQARFAKEPSLGQLFLRKLIHRKPPSIGFHLLARILNNTRHKVVITTNFDHLVEDAIAITENEAVQSYGHDKLAGFLKGRANHPAIVKIHGDIMLQTFNAVDELVELSDEWKDALSGVFQTFTPIVIGYGGNDPGFMDFFIEEMNTWEPERRCYWFVRSKARFADVRNCAELSKIPALRLVECPGFTELMFLLDENFDYTPLHEQLRQRADTIAADLKTAGEKARGEVEAHHRKLRESTMTSETSVTDGATGEFGVGRPVVRESWTWRNWRDAIVAERNDPKEQKRLCEEATKAFPDSRPLKAAIANYALSSLPADGSHIEKIEKLLKESEALSGGDSDDTLAIMHALAWSWTSAGDHEKAENLYRRVVAERERILGLEHPDTLMSRNNFAGALQSQGRHAEAEKEHREVQAIRERVLGPEHPDTLASRTNLANALHSQGRTAEAEKECRAVLAVEERTLGPEHADVFSSCYNLSLCLDVQGKESEALELARRAFSGWTKILGEQHSDTLDAKRMVKRLETE